MSPPIIVKMVRMSLGFCHCERIDAKTVAVWDNGPRESMRSDMYAGTSGGGIKRFASVVVGSSKSNSYSTVSALRASRVKHVPLISLIMFGSLQDTDIVELELRGSQEIWIIAFSMRGKVTGWLSLQARSPRSLNLKLSTTTSIM